MNPFSVAAAVIGTVVVVLSGSLMPAATSPSTASGVGTADASAAVNGPSGTLEQISVKPNGEPPRAASESSVVSDDGRYVVFASTSARLVPGTGRNPRHRWHLYLRDTRAATTALVDARTDGRLPKAAANQFEFSISADGGLVAFASSSTHLTSAESGLTDGDDVFLRDTAAGVTTIVSVAADGGPADDESSDATISPDGTTVVFGSTATNIVPGGTYGLHHLYRHDLATGETTLVSATPDGEFPNGSSYSPSTNIDGGLIVFETEATDIVPNGSPGTDVVRYDVGSRASTLINQPPSGEPPDEFSADAVISADGGTIAYDSAATNLVVDDDNHDVDVFVFDVASGVTTIINHKRHGQQTGRPSSMPSISADGTLVAYTSAADHIVKGDGNDHTDVFLFESETDMTTLVSRTPEGTSANGESFGCDLSGDGTSVTFTSWSTDLMPGGTRANQIYLYRAD